MKILCLISTFERGGAERVMVWLCRKLIDRGHEVTIACFASRDHSDITNQPNDVPVIHLNQLGSSKSIWQALKANLQRFATVRQLYRIHHPQLIISFLDKTNVVALGASFRMALPVIVAEHTDPARSNLGAFWSLGRRYLYPHAKLVILLSEGMRTFFPATIQPRIRIMPNPLLVPAENQQILPPVGRKRLLSVGRLHAVKAFDRLIRAFTSLADAFPDWDLVIVGEGPERTALEAEIARYNMKNRISLPGDVDGPFAFYSSSDAFVLTSYREGFPLVIVEAMACGLPVITVDCSPALGDILEGGHGGLIVPNHNPQALVSGLKTLMEDEDLRKRLGQSGISVAARYASDRIFERWEHIIGEATT